MTESEVLLRQLLRALPEEPRVVVTGNHVTPWHTLGLVDEVLDSFRLWMLNAQPGVPDREGVIFETPFVGPGMRTSPRLRYTPCRLSMVPALFRSTQQPDVVVLHTTKPRDGKISLGTEVNILPAAIEAVRRRGGVVIAQANAHMPWTNGDAVIPLDMVDVVIDVDAVLPSAPDTTPDDESMHIGSMVAVRVLDGSTLQAGIGAVPDAVLRGLLKRAGLRIWTEMFSDSVLSLERAGALDLAVPITASFLFGSPELYEWADDNDRIRMIRTEKSNDPARIAKNPQMVSVNTALQVDLFGHANASRINARIHSGFGGQTDFIVGALHSQGGQAIMALRSWHPKANRSTIVSHLNEPVTSFQPSAIITEQGTANVFGYTEKEQARHIITNAAHPSVRDELWEEAVHLGLARRRN